MSLRNSIGEQSAGVGLLAEVLRRSGTAHLRVQGSSMLPAIRPGDEIQIQSAAISMIQAGDIVAFLQEERLFVHRVIARCEDDRLLTRGDALRYPDSPVGNDEFLGKVTEVAREGVAVALQNSFLQRTAAALFRRSRTCSALFLKFASI